MYWRFLFLTSLVVFGPTLSFGEQRIEDGRCSVRRDRAFRDIFPVGLKAVAYEDRDFRAFANQREHRTRDNSAYAERSERYRARIGHHLEGRQESNRHRSANDLNRKIQTTDLPKIINRYIRIEDNRNMNAFRSDRRRNSYKSQRGNEIRVYDSLRQSRFEQVAREFGQDENRNRHVTRANVGLREERQHNDRLNTNYRSNIRQEVRFRDHLTRYVSPLESRRDSINRKVFLENRDGSTRKIFRDARSEPKILTARHDNSRANAYSHIRRHSETEMDKKIASDSIMNIPNERNIFATTTDIRENLDLSRSGTYEKRITRHGNMETLGIERRMNQPYFKNLKNLKGKSQPPLVTWQYLFYSIQLVYIGGIVFHLYNKKKLKTKRYDWWNPSQSVLVKLD